MQQKRFASDRHRVRCAVLAPRRPASQAQPSSSAAATARRGRLLPSPRTAPGPSSTPSAMERGDASGWGVVDVRSTHTRDRIRVRAAAPLQEWRGVAEESPLRTRTSLSGTRTELLRTARAGGSVLCLVICADGNASHRPPSVARRLKFGSGGSSSKSRRPEVRGIPDCVRCPIELGREIAKLNAESAWSSSPSGIMASSGCIVPGYASTLKPGSTSQKRKAPRHSLSVT